MLHFAMSYVTFCRKMLPRPSLPPRLYLLLYSLLSQTRLPRWSSRLPVALLGTRFARLGRFPMGRAHPQGAVTARIVVQVDRRSGNREVE